MTRHETELLGAYVLGALEPGDRDTVQGHLAGCDECLREVDDLREIEAALGEMPPEVLIEGPPDGGDLLLQRTLNEMRGQRGRTDRQRLAVRVAAASLAGAAVLTGGALVGRQTAPPAALPAPSPSTVAGTRAGTATNPRTGASMNVSVTPAAGWVRVHATVSGVAAGQECRLVVVARHGTNREAGTWKVSEKAATTGTPIDGVALVAPDDVASVRVETFAGQPLVAVAL